MLEKQFVKEIENRGYNVDCQNGEELIVLKDNEEVARVSAFHPFKMDSIDSPLDILEIIVDFSSTKYEDRFLKQEMVMNPKPDCCEECGKIIDDIKTGEPRWCNNCQ